MKMEVQVEAHCSSDSSWHPCLLSLRPDGVGGGLLVKLEDRDSEFVIMDVKDVATTLRFRSLPLQEDDCASIQEGKHVLALCRHEDELDSEGLFLDAVVVKVIRVRHSKRACCRCTFLVKWIPHHIESETATVPSASIKKLAAESISCHPVVAKFLESVKTNSLPLLSPAYPESEETESGVDIHEFLERQIEEIGSLADISNNELWKHSLSGVEHGVGGGWQAQSKTVSELVSKLHVGVTCVNNVLRTSSSKEKKTPAKVEVLVTSAPCSVEKSEETRSPLSPLAARAVLASLVSKLPQKLEFVDRESVEYVAVSDIPMKKMNGLSMSICSDSHTLNHTEIKTADLVTTTKQGTSVKRLYTQKFVEEPHMDDYHISKPREESGGFSASYVRCDESIQPTIGRRLTRSAAKRVRVAADREVESTLSKETFVGSQVSHSVNQGANIDTTDGQKEALHDKPVRATRLSYTMTKQKSETSNVKDEISVSVDRKAKHSILTTNARVTRSSARRGTGIREEYHDEPVSASAQSDCNAKNDIVPDCRASTKVKVSHLLTDELKVFEGKKKQKRLDAAERRHQSAAVDGMCTDVDIKSSPREGISLKNQRLRSSPRFSSLPRTQTKTGYC